MPSPAKVKAPQPSTMATKPVLPPMSPACWAGAKLAGAMMRPKTTAAATPSAPGARRARASPPKTSPARACTTSKRPSGRARGS